MTRQMQVAARAAALLLLGAGLGYGAESGRHLIKHGQGASVAALDVKAYNAATARLIADIARQAQNNADDDRPPSLDAALDEGEPLPARPVDALQRQTAQLIQDWLTQGKDEPSARDLLRRALEIDQQYRTRTQGGD